MNLSMHDLRAHLSTWYNWWLGGWQDAWAMLPKPAALQTRPDVFQTLDGAKISFVALNSIQGTWQTAAPASGAPRGLLFADDNVLLRELKLPHLNERDIAAAVSIEAQVNSPFPPSETHYGYNIHRLPSGSLRIEIAIIHSRQLAPSAQPQRALFARGQHGAIPLQGSREHTPFSTWYRSPLTLSLCALLTLVIIVWAISPTLLLRAESMLNEAALAQLSARTTPLLQKREELSALQQQLENIHAFDNEHPNPLVILDQLTAQIPDGTWLTQFSLRKDQLTLDGVSDNAIAIVSQLEKLPDLKGVRLGSSINRDPRSGGETYQILARIQPGAATANGTKP